MVDSKVSTDDVANIMGLGAVSADYWRLVVFIGSWWFFAWYFGPKVEKAKRNASEPSEGPPDTLTLVRAIDGTNYLRKFAILIDHAKVGYIGPGEVRHFHVSPGVHRVAVQVDFCKSRELTFEMLQGVNRRVNCGSTYNDWRCLYMWLLKPRDYVYVRIHTDARRRCR